LKFLKIPIICLIVLLLSSILFPAEDVLATTTFVDEIDVSGDTIFPDGMDFNSDGTTMLVADGDGDQILEYACTVGFDVSTCTNSGTDDLDLGAIIDSTLSGVTFNSAGTIMLIADSDNITDEIKEFTCTVGFDVSTCTTTGTDDLDINGDLSNVAVGIAFNSAGTTMLIADDGDQILEYTCTVGFDVSTCTTTGADDFDTSGQTSSLTDVAFNSAGTKMFVTDDNSGQINEYSLSSGFDVSTATFVNVLDISTQQTQPAGIAFSTDGLTMFISGDGGGGEIAEYTLEVTFDLFSSPVTSSSSGGGGSDNRHMTRPTFGLDHNTFQQIVKGGFSFNGIPQDISDNFWTPFEEQDVKIGEINTFSAKVYADKKLKVQEFLFGIPIVGDAHKAELGIEVFYDSNGDMEEVKVIQKTDVIDEFIQVITSKSKCLLDDVEEKCVTTMLSIKFLEPLQDKVMAIKAIDFKGRSHITYLNEGFDISGNSLNPMTTMMILGTEKYEGTLEVTQTAKYSDIWTSADGRMFEINDYGSSKQINQSFERHIDTGVMRDRLHSGFLTYQQEQIIKAETVLEQLCEFCNDESYGEINETFAYDFPFPEKNNIDADLAFEELKAKKTLDTIWKQIYPGMVFD
jgi:hypothetical protein